MPNERRQTNKRHVAVFGLLFLIGYLAVVASLGSHSAYFEAFDSTGWRLVNYNVMRLLLAIYLVALFVASGDLLLRTVLPSVSRDSSIGDWLLVRFFPGFALWNLLALVLGVAGLLERPIALALTVATFAIAGMHWIRRGFHFPEHEARKHAPVQTRAVRIVRTTCIGIAFLSALLLLVAKGLFPAGGHDYFTHYFHFYMEVVNSGEIRPNDVWYHYYYSKGAGAFFLAMLLSDPLAPSLVTLCLMLGASVAIAAALRHLNTPPYLRYLTAACFLAIYVYTPGPPANMAHGGWGDFEKLHELQTALFAFLAYVLIRTAATGGGGDAKLAIAGTVAASAAVIITPSIAAFYLPSIAVVAAVHVLFRRHADARQLVLMGFGIVVSLVAILLLNQLATGLASDQGIVFFWRFADFGKLRDWGVLPELIRIYGWHVHAATLAAPPLGPGVARFVAEVFRLDLTWPFLAVPAVVASGLALAARTQPSLRFRRLPTLAVIAAFALVGILLSVVVGRLQEISFYRFSSFLVPIPILAGFTLLFAVTEDWSNLGTSARSWRAKTLCAGAALMAVVLATYPILKVLKTARAREVVKVSTRFARGKISISQAYSQQTAWPGRPPWGAIYPAARAAFGKLPPKSRVRSLNTPAYCMIPGCKFESHISYKLGADFLDVMYGSPPIARAALSGIGMNHFFISTEFPIQDPLAGSPLFNPKTIATHMAVVWTDGVSVLLTWKGAESSQEPDPSWIRSYATRFEESHIDLASEGSTERHIAKILQQLRSSGQPMDLRFLDWQSGVIKRPTQ